MTKEFQMKGLPPLCKGFTRNGILSTDEVPLKAMSKTQANFASNLNAITGGDSLNEKPSLANNIPRALIDIRTLTAVAAEIKSTNRANINEQLTTGDFFHC